MSDDTAGSLGALRSRLRFGKFVSVGVVGALCDTVVLLLLVEVVGLLEEAAVLVGIETAILVMFLINDNWTFADQGRAGRSWLGRLLRSHLVRSVGSLAQFLVFVVLYRALFVSVTVFGLDAWLLFGKGAGIACGMVVNYVFESLFTWQVRAGP